MTLSEFSQLSNHAVVIYKLYIFAHNFIIKIQENKLLYNLSVIDRHLAVKGMQKKEGNERKTRKRQTMMITRESKR